MSTGYFVTGTDTGVGKTFVAAALARRARAQGVKVFAFKPVETGVSLLEPEGPDQSLLCEAAGNWQTGELRGVYRFAVPAAPLVAAKSDGTSVDLDLMFRALAAGIVAIRDPAHRPERPDGLSIVEGAGGWRVPITDRVDMGGFAKRIGFPVIVVARAGLGTINHSLLTLEAIERDGCSIAALVLSVRPEDDFQFARSNAEQISRRWPGPVLLLQPDLEETLDRLL